MKWLIFTLILILFWLWVRFGTKGTKKYMSKGLLKIVNRGNTDEVNSFLADGVADVNTTFEHGNTALICAAKKGYTDIVKLLLSKNADVNAENSSGKTALIEAADWSCTYDTFDVVRVLLDAGANINVKDKNGETALMIAKKRRHTELVELLKQHGAKE